MEYYTRFSAQASLVPVGVRMRHLKVWWMIKHKVHIVQKTIKYQPTDKLLDAFINILAGGHGLVEVNTRVRPDEGLQRAFGRQGCADQSTISDTLNACTPETVEQLRAVLQALYQRHSRGYQHAYDRRYQLLEVDISGMPAGRQGEGVTKGYFSGQKNRRGRQLGRVLATWYDEIVVERLYAGQTQLEQSLQDLVAASEAVLELDEARRTRTVVRVDGGGGRDADVNWLLERGYLILIKVKNWQRATKLSRSVHSWVTDPKTGDRQVGWVEQPHSYRRPTRQLAVRSRLRDGTWHHRVLVLNLPDALLFELAGAPMPPAPTAATPEQLGLAALHAYDQRGGGVETSLKGSKQGLGLTQRNKHRMAAQEMLVLLAELAYNLLTWTRQHLAASSPRLAKFGPLRMVRDLFHIPGRLRFDTEGHLLEITLSQNHELAPPLVQAVSSLLAQDGTALNLGQI
jgi:hypothetical protein